jgi:hypothetical protein
VGGGNYALLNADASIDYDTFTGIANFLQLYIIDNEHFQRIVQMMSDPNIGQHLGSALEQVLAPEQNMVEESQESVATMGTSVASRATSVSITYGSTPALMASFLRNILSIFFTASAVALIENPNIENPAVGLIQELSTDVSEEASQETQDGLDRIETVITPNVEQITNTVEQRIEHPPVFGEGNTNVVSSAESSQSSEFSVNEAADVLMDMPDSNRLGGRKRKTRAKKQKGGKRRKTMKKSKKSKLRKHKTVKRRKSYRRRNTRKM